MKIEGNKRIGGAAILGTAIFIIAAGAIEVSSNPDTFGGRVEIEGSTVRLIPADSFRSRVFVASLGLWLTLDAGTFEAIEIDMENRRPVRIALSKAAEYFKAARLRVKAPGGEKTGLEQCSLAGLYGVERGAHLIPLSSDLTWVDIEYLLLR